LHSIKNLDSIPYFIQITGNPCQPRIDTVLPAPVRMLKIDLRHRHPVLLTSAEPMNKLAEFEAAFL
jgi:hypothetical protein